MVVTHLRSFVLLVNLVTTCLEFRQQNQLFQVSYKPVIPKLKPTIDIDKTCFIKSGSFTCRSKQSWCYDIPLEVLALLYAFQWEVLHSSGKL